MHMAVSIPFIHLEILFRGERGLELSATDEHFNLGLYPIRLSTIPVRMVESNVPDERQTSRRLLPDILSRSVPLSFIMQENRGSSEQVQMLKLRLNPRSRCIRAPLNLFSWTRCTLWAEQWSARSNQLPLSCPRMKQNSGILGLILSKCATLFGRVDAHAHAEFTWNQVHLKRLNATDEQSSTEVVNARFVVGTDG